jgi:hypothetical protein
MKPTVADSRTPNRLILRGPAGDLCHGRGRGFGSCRPRHSFQKSYADFIETIEDAKRARFAPFLCPFSATRSFLSRNECPPILFGRGRKDQRHDRRQRCMLRGSYGLRVNVQR